MDIWEAIDGRRSVRRYQKKPVSEELILKVIDAARHAPSSKNSQPWKFVVIKNREVLNRLSQIHPWAWQLRDTPTGILCLAEEEASQHHYPMDVSCAIQNMMLAAHTLGLGTCYIAVYSVKDNEIENKAREILEIPRTHRIMAIISLGFPAKKPKPKPLKPLEQTVFWEKLEPNLEES